MDYIGETLVSTWVFCDWFLPVYAFGNASCNRESICFLHWKSFWPFTEVINEEYDTGVALLGLWERSWWTEEKDRQQVSKRGKKIFNRKINEINKAKTYNVNPNNIPRRVHFYRPDSPCQVFIPLCVLTGITYFNLKQQRVIVKLRQCYQNVPEM